MAHDLTEQPLEVVAGLVQRPRGADGRRLEPGDQGLRAFAQHGVLLAERVDLRRQVGGLGRDLVVQAFGPLRDLDVLVDGVREVLEAEQDLLAPLGLAPHGGSRGRLLDVHQRVAQVRAPAGGLSEGRAEVVLAFGHPEHLRRQTARRASGPTLEHDPERSGPNNRVHSSPRPEEGTLVSQVLEQSAEILRACAPRLLIRWLAEQPHRSFRTLDGSMVFVDISGFTKMSERLARHGKVGAEEVSEVLGAVFAKLLGVAYGEDGSLLKFGGDALLLWFSGSGHAQRAATAAHGMRATLRSVGRLDTTAGKVLLRMSVGVNTGSFHFFLVGESHRELIVTGPAASRTVEMESTATAGEILGSGDTAAALPARSLGQPKGEGILLRSGPPTLSFGRDDAEVLITSIDVAQGIPVTLREHLLSGAAEPEHRTATVAFVHFDGVDDLIEHRGVDVTAAGLHELIACVQRAAEDNGVTFLGTDIGHDGGKVILGAGAPNALGDDEGRMLLTLRSVIDADTTVPVRIGVNKGPVFAGDIGPGYRRTYTVMGDAVNLAARVMSMA